MSSLPFQNRSAKGIYRRFFTSNEQVVALADETGLGKTHVVVELIAKLAERNPRKPIVVFYIASNLTLVEQNAKQILRYVKARLPQESARVVLGPRRILSLDNIASEDGRIFILPLTPTTSMTLKSNGTREERLLVQEERRKFEFEKKTKDHEIKRILAWNLMLKTGWMPDLVVLDEYQSYANSLQWPRSRPVLGAKYGKLVDDPGSLLPELICAGGIKTLLVSATPFELKLPDLTLEEKLESKKTRLSFEFFSQLLCQYDPEKSKAIQDARYKYEVAWRKLVRLLNRVNSSTNFTGKSNRDAEIEEAKTEVKNSRDLYKALLKNKLLRTYREGVVPVDLGPIDVPSNESSRTDLDQSFKDLFNLHVASHRSDGWRDNCYYFSSTVRFHELKTKSQYHYSLGKRISPEARKMLNQQVDEMFDRFPKGRLLDKELRRAKLDVENPPLWVKPSVSEAVVKKSSDKILIFSNLLATPHEVIERLKDPELPDEDRIGKHWYLSKAHTVSEATLNWMRPSILLEEVCGESDPELDRWSWEIVKEGHELVPEWESVEKSLQNAKVKSQLARSPGTLAMKSLGHVLKTYGFPCAKLREIIDNPRILLGMKKLKEGLDHYLGNPRSLWIMLSDLKEIEVASEIQSDQETTFAETVRKYCKRHLWYATWVEYWDQLLGGYLSVGEFEDFHEVLEDTLFEIAEVMNFKPYQKRKTIVEKGEERSKVAFRSHVAATFGRQTDSQQDLGEQSRPKTVRNAFNSPFAPFVLVTTSVGEEGLDFHKYCKTEIHWDPPRSGTALAQRIGRVVRFRGLLQRRSLLNGQRLSHFTWKEVATPFEDSEGLAPNFQPFDLEKNAPRVVLFAVPFTQQYQQALSVRQHYADLKYFVGMSSKELEQMLSLVVSLPASQKRHLDDLRLTFEP